MDDLTELKGIGKSGAKVLAKAGLRDFAEIAAADPKTRPDGLAASVDWDAVIAEAKEFAAGAASQTSETTPTPDAQASSSDSDTLTGEFLLVTGPKKGRWRAGRHFTAEPRLLDLASLSDQEMKLILEDDALSAEMLTGDEVVALQNEAG